MTILSTEDPNNSSSKDHGGIHTTIATSSPESDKPPDGPLPIATTNGYKPAGNNPDAKTNGTDNQVSLPLMEAPNGNVVDTLSLRRTDQTCMEEESSIVQLRCSAGGRETHGVAGGVSQMVKVDLQQSQQPNMTVGWEGNQLAMTEATRGMHAFSFLEKDSHFKSPNIDTQPREKDYGPLNIDLHSHTPSLLIPLSNQSPISPSHNKIKTPGTLKVYSKGTWCRKKKGLLNTCTNLTEEGMNVRIQQQHETTPGLNHRPIIGHEVPNSDTETNYEMNPQPKNNEDITEHFQQAKQQ